MHMREEEEWEEREQEELRRVLKGADLATTVYASGPKQNNAATVTYFRKTHPLKDNNQEVSFENLLWDNN